MEKGNLNSLDDFITTIVMNFELTAPVKRVLSRLSEIRKKGNEYLVSFSDNGLITESMLLLEVKIIREFWLLFLKVIIFLMVRDFWDEV